MLINADWYDTLKVLSSKGDELKQKLETPGKPSVLELAEFEGSDDELRSLLAEISRLREQEGALVGAANAQFEKYRALSLSLTERQSVLKDLQSLDLRNDLDQARQRLLAASLRRTILNGVAESAVRLRRAFLYYTGNAIKAPEDVVFFAEDEKSSADLDLTFNSQDEIVSRLAATRKEAERSYRSLAELSEQQANAYRDAAGVRFPEAVLFSARVQSSRSTPSLPEKARSDFLEALNHRLADIVRIGKPEVGNPLLIPFAPPLTSGTGPERILGAVVTRVEVDDQSLLDGRELQLRVVHPGFGSYELGENCYFVDSGKRPDLRSISVWPSRIPPQTADWQERLIGAATLGSAFLSSNFPFRAPYLLYVMIPEPQSWPKAPQITRLEIRFVKVGER